MGISEEAHLRPLGVVRRRARPSYAWAAPAVLAACDLTLLAFAFSLAIAVWMQLRTDVPLEFYLAHWPVFAFFLVVYGLNGLYRSVGLPAVDELRKTFVATTAGFLILVAASFFVKESALYSRGIAALAWAVCVVLLPVLRYGLRRSLAEREWFGSDAVVVGSREVVERIEAALRAHGELGLRPRLRTVLPTAPDDSAALPPDELSGWLRPAGVAGISTCIIAIPSLRGLRTGGVVSELTAQFRRVIVVPEMEGVPSLWISATDLYGLVGIEMKDNLLQPAARLAKRALDLSVCAVLALPVLLLCGLVALVVRLSSRGPVLYWQRRLGRGGAPFNVYKFRTMVHDSERALADHLAGDSALAEEWRLHHKLRRDPRITGVGAFLRRTSLDELPQFWNVLSGEMSLVGPRPIVEAEVERFGLGYALYTRVSPGLSGLWQISGRSNTSYAQRVDLDEYYVRNWSIWLDLHVLIRTVWTVLRHAGAY